MFGIVQVDGQRIKQRRARSLLTASRMKHASMIEEVISIIYEQFFVGWSAKPIGLSTMSGGFHNEWWLLHILIPHWNLQRFSNATNVMPRTNSSSTRLNTLGS